MVNCVEPIIGIVKSVGGPIWNYLKYQINFHDHLEKFNESKGRLCTRRDDIKSKLDSELQQGKVARGEVQTWLNDVEKFLARQEVANEVNSWGCLSCCCRVKVLQERDQELQKIYNRGGSLTTGCLVKDDPSVSGVELPTTELQGSGDVKAEILTSLKGDEVTKLGVWGMGGVGKTTIMMHVHNELLNKPPFKKVIWVTVSQTFDIYKLQEQIACSLKQKLEEPQNTTNRAAVLSKMLEKQKPYLLILDDVWESFKLTAVGIPEPLKSNGCKLVLTTRSHAVAREMDCKITQVKTLSPEEALKLFMHKVGNAVLSDQGCIKGALEADLKGIVNECNGLPLAIVTVAGSLKGVFQPRLWSAALNQLKNCKRNVAGTNDDDAFGVLKFSYDRLKPSKIQHCFLCCALFPEDHNIPIDSIIDYWIDEGLIDEMETVQAMKDEGLDILKKLEDNCLLESSKDIFENDFVRMHDLVRDMALQITRTSPRFMVEAGKALAKLPEKGKWKEDLEKVSLMWNGIEEIPSSILFSKCTMLTTLLLSHNNLSTISESVFEHMPVLKILDLSYNYELRSLPSSISKLVNLTTLLLQSCKSLAKLPSFSELGALKKLNLDHTAIKEVPKGLEMCTNLEYLSLCTNLTYGEYCAELEEIFLNLSKLQQLFLNEGIVLEGEVIGRLEKLEAFRGRFPTACDWNFFWKCVHDRGDKLSRYCLRVGRDRCYHLGGYRTVEFNGIDIVGANIILPPSVNELCIRSCGSLRSLNDFSSIEDAKYLKSCEIYYCEGMECVFSSWINPLVQTLEELSLWGMIKLKGLFEAELMAMSPSPPPGTFASLKSISLYGCGIIKKFIPSLKLLGYLQSLERIDVKDCEELEEIIASDPEEGGDIIKKLIFPKLKQLELYNLPALKSICSRIAVLGCDSLEEIEVRNCKELEEIVALDPEGGGGDIIKKLVLPKLKWLKLYNLPAVKRICSRSVVMGCDSLQEIEVSDCEELEEIIALDPEGGDIIKKLILPKLRLLKLFNLPALKSICSRRVVMVCDSLEEINVRDCKELEEIIASDPEGEGGNIIKKLILPKLKQLKLHNLPALKSICSRIVVMGCDSLEDIEVSDCEELEEIIALDPEEGEGGDIIKKLILPKLKWLSLSNFPALKSICSRMVVMVCDSLEQINVERCKELEEIIASDPEGEGGDIITKLIVPKLKRLKLYDLPALKSICSRSAIMGCDSLEEINVQYCEKLEEIIASDSEGGDIIKKLILPKLNMLLLYNLPALKSICSRRVVMVCDSLQRIHVGYCKQLEEIIASDPKEGGGDIIKKLILPKLKWLKLENLPALKSICSRSAVMGCDSLKEIEISDCEELEEIIALDPEEGEGGEIIKKLILPKLKLLRLYKLPALKSICSRRVVMVCDSLEEIKVGHCKELEEIIASDPEGEGGDIIKKLILPKLKWLELDQLPALKSICSRSAVMGCDSLEQIRIWRCKDLRSIPVYLPLVDNAQPSPPPSLEEISTDSEEWWESLEWDHPNEKDVLRPMVKFSPSKAILSLELEESESEDYPKD